MRRQPRPPSLPPVSSRQSSLAFARGRGSPRPPRASCARPRSRCPTLVQFLLAVALVTSTNYHDDELGGSRGSRRSRRSASLARAQNANATSSGNSTTPIPLVVTNSCPDTVWPGVGTQNGIGPGTGGFELTPGSSRQMYVSADWQGRVWGRTNCSFNADGSGPSNLDGVNGQGASCLTGDCFGRLSCVFTGQVPTTLAEFNLIGGVEGKQTFYDISLVDGYNLPLAIVYIPAANTTWIPPNLTNCACIATAGYLAQPNRTGLNAYTNASYPLPYETSQTNDGVADWCPWPLQEYPPERPGDGVYPYPDSTIQRPVFDPCLSACAATNSPQDCCTGAYNDPSVCKASLYSREAKAVCPDAYSFAFDDQTSTFIVPNGGGWRVVFCPEGRSTNILRTFGAQLQALASGNKAAARADILAAASNYSYIDAQASGAGPAVTGSGMAVVAVVGVGLVMGYYLLLFGTW